LIAEHSLASTTNNQGEFRDIQRSGDNFKIVRMNLIEDEAPMILDIRAATVSDAPTVHRLVKDLAASQGQAGEMRATIEDIGRDGFGPDALFHSILAESDGEAIGLALYFYIYSTWRGGSVLYVEDLIVADNARGQGVGTALMRDLARIAKARHCSNLELSVGSENTARVFYEGLGLRRKGDWLPYTIYGNGLDRLAGGAER
jgi:diamine N-acetyltransferase